MSVLVPPESARARFFRAVVEQLGKVVLMGGRAPDVFDCSELVAWGVLQAGGEDQRGTHTAQRYHDETRAVRIDEQRLPGDLVFYGRDAKSIIHVAVLDDLGGCISADGATRKVTSLAEALSNPSSRVRRHNTIRYRRDCPFIVVHRNTFLDDLDHVSR